MKKSLISAIKKLLAKLGAEKIEGNNLVDVIDSGADALANAGGDSYDYVTVTADSTGGSTVYSADKSFSEIKPLLNEGKTIYMNFVSVNRGGTSAPKKSLNPIALADGNTVCEGVFLMGVVISGSTKTLTFTRITIGSSGITYTNLNVSAT